MARIWPEVGEGRSYEPHHSEWHGFYRLLKIALVSDTHMPHKAKQLPQQLLAAMRSEKVACTLHMGDLTTPEVIEIFESVAPFEAVAGNNDTSEVHRRFGRKKIVEFGSFRIGMVHGDGTKKTTVERSWRAFADDKVDVILFGHSHIPYCQQRDGIWLINPGSPTDKRRSPFFSYGILELKKRAITPRLYFF